MLLWLSVFVDCCMLCVGIAGGVQLLLFSNQFCANCDRQLVGPLNIQLFDFEPQRHVTANNCLCCYAKSWGNVRQLGRQRALH